MACPRIVVVLECEGESGSEHLEEFLDQARDVIQTPDYVFVLKGGAYDLEHLWVTSSLRS